MSKKIKSLLPVRLWAAEVLPSGEMQRVGDPELFSFVVREQEGRRWVDQGENALVFARFLAFLAGQCFGFMQEGDAEPRPVVLSSYERGTSGVSRYWIDWLDSLEHNLRCEEQVWRNLAQSGPGRGETEDMQRWLADIQRRQAEQSARDCSLIV